MDLVTAARVLGFAGITAAIGAIVYAHRPQSFKTALPILLALLFLPLAAPIAVWAIGGMEQPLVAGLLAWAMVFATGHSRKKPTKHLVLVAGFSLGIALPYAA